MRSAALAAPRPITAWRSGARSTRAAMPAAAARKSSDQRLVRVRAPPYCDVPRAMTTMGRIARTATTSHAPPRMRRSSSGEGRVPQDAPQVARAEEREGREGEDDVRGHLALGDAEHDEHDGGPERAEGLLARRGTAAGASPQIAAGRSALHGKKPPSRTGT